MNKPTSMSRRTFVTRAGTLALAPAIGVGFSACGGGSDSSPPLQTDQSQQLSLTATQAVSAMATGQLSSETYVRTLLGRASSLSNLHAFITLNQGAIASARAVDAARAAGQKLPPLAGLPIVVKDNINTKNLPTTGGTPRLQNFQPKNDAVVLERLLAAGAIVLGKANMHELAFGITTTNFSPFAGFARNPYDTNRMVGGSSGGTGVAIAARMAPVGLGTDTGGSVRIPAALNGIAGLRPSVGNGGAERRYDGTGVIPLSHTRDTVGPMGRTLEDVALIDAVITGTEVPTAASLSGLRFGIPATTGTLSTTRSCR